MKLIQRVTNLTAATNYGKECDKNGLASDGTNIPLYSKSPGGPFLLSANTRAVPERYVMTKTHCGGRCNSCGPKKYIMDEESFLDWCLLGGKYVPEEDGASMDFINVHYNASLVARAIHLIRDPFDNVVSNFHLEQHERSKSGDKKWLAKFSNDQEGFQNWCGYLDSRYTEEESNHKAIDKKMIKMFKDVPCHGDFYRYAQWHNYAIKVTRRLKLPTLVMHYENYGKDYQNSVELLLGFLQLPKNGIPANFVAGKSYKMDFFTEKQRNATMALIQSLTDKDAWELLKRYEES
eukprot:CAMPEP_0183310518 /NCGR_PEP_ID=MMETSP0160_2-20130417/31862_1 /TAXON_ID=2839 ORGANISM="Odontella Sinensis, Strain Grunow 1884" /NCGR_SAMPLE_ID=MMETSP0160_2 /ASSEMBLY_ACC=CAM_ASM_000250 /LENGTH=291 /DNA_ID=CAMNT_0025474797 /DNA_START=66 /DNA_END=941 /DNA_ORIENTATION=-